ncbi:MAG TPA: periplasmic heavy metal sensor [Chlorobaculum parvum]|uniref:Periplasmic heavy metal sensor n=1 Tax=Chlorobaculum parvum TaxID=274539 RepID=A0A7C5DDV7_9CHLB|nr:periplasmic heavy metal sensor [Chlorobaculum parvum]
MDFLSSKRFITTSLVILVILNLTLMGVIWWQNFVSSSCQTVEVTRYYSGSRPPRVELELTEKQKTEFRKLRKAHFRKTMPTVRKIVELKKALIAESVKPAPDKQKLAAFADSIGQRQAWLETNLANHFHELAVLCTSSQRDSLEKMLGNIYHLRYQKMSSWRHRAPGKYNREMKPVAPPLPPEKP